MKIKEAEERTGLTRKAIRYYESNGLIHPAQSEENGYKDYDEETIRSLLLIRKLRLLDFSVPQIRQYLSGDDPSRLLKKRIQEEQQTLSKAKQDDTPSGKDKTRGRSGSSGCGGPSP